MKSGIINVKLIKKYIKENNLTIKKFCKKCEISYYTYLKMMKNTLTKFRPVYNVAVVMRVSMNDLLGV